MQARYKLHKTICSRTASFKWLLDTHTSEGSSGTTKMVSQIFYLTQDGGVIVCMSSLLKASMFETTLYYDSPRSWFVPILDYPMNNLERYRRFVSV